MINTETGLSKEESEIIQSRAKNNGTHYEVIFVSEKQKRKKPKNYYSSVGYDFLQYRRVVYHWAEKKYEISAANIDLLLFLFPLGPFSSSMFVKVCKIHTIMRKYLLKKFREEGFIIIRRDSNMNKRQKRLFALSDKAQKMCARMHKIMVGEEKIPEWANPLLSSEATIDKYYMTLIRDMNKRNEKRIEHLKKEKASK